MTIGTWQQSCIDNLERELVAAQARIGELEAQLARAQDAVRLAATTFRHYEALHREKPDHVKADANADLAAKMEYALAAARPEPQ